MAGDVAVIATIGGAVVGVVAVKVAAVAADATAVDHVVAGHAATVAVCAALVAVGSVAALAPVAAGTASLARLASGKNSGTENQTNDEDALHRDTYRCYRFLRAFLRALRASLRFRFSLPRSTLRVGAWKWPRSRDCMFIMPASWSISMPPSILRA